MPEIEILGDINIVHDLIKTKNKTKTFSLS